MSDLSAAAAIDTTTPQFPVQWYFDAQIYDLEKRLLFEREFVEAEQAAYRETAIEDAEICARMTEGRRALLQQGLNEAGPCQSPLEDGMVHFHGFLRAQLEPHVA